MSKELLTFAETVANEKGVDQQTVLEAIQAALESATRKTSGIEMDVRVALDPLTGDFETFRRWRIVEDQDYQLPESELTVDDVEERGLNLQVGEYYEEPMESIDFGRIASQTAKQVLMQKVREAERDLVIKEYESKVGQLVTGVVKKTTRDSILVDLGGKAEALLPRSDILANEIFRPGDRIRALLANVEDQQRGPQLFLSRTAPEMLIELFSIEVPEVGEGIIEIKAAARDPGHRAKIAVKTNDGRIDPVGACVGMRGSRVQAVSGELAGERVDIILWDDNPAQLVINAMAPAEVNSIVVDEDNHTMDIAVGKEFLSQAIGRGGQNVRLASQLTGWTLNVMTDEDFASKSQEESGLIMKLFTDQLGVDEEVAAALIESGFSSLEEIAYVPKEELEDIEGFDDDIIEELRNRANDILLTKALAGEPSPTDKQPAADLLELEGMDAHLAAVLAHNGIVTREDLAEQSIDDLMEIDGMDEERAGKLIMKARAHWFAD